MTVDYRAENLRRAEAVKAEKQEAQKDLRAYNLKRAQEVKEQKAPPASPSVPGESPRSRESPDRELSRKETELQRQREAYERGGDYGTYSRFYREKYLPAYKRAEQWQKRRKEEARRQTVQEVRSQYPELTEQEMKTVEANVEYIQSQPPDQQQELWEQFMDPYAEIVGVRRETYGPDYPRAGEVEPFWSKFKAAPVSIAPGAGDIKELATGFVKTMEPFGKGLAELATGRLSFFGGTPIQPVEREWKPTPLEYGGELLGSYALGAGAGRVVGGAVGFVAPPVARGAGAVGSKLGRLAPVGQKLGAVGAKVAKEPALVKMFVGGVYGGMELGKIKSMAGTKKEYRIMQPELGPYSWRTVYEPAFTPEEIGMEVGRDVAFGVGFIRGVGSGRKPTTEEKIDTSSAVYKPTTKEPPVVRMLEGNLGKMKPQQYYSMRSQYGLTSERLRLATGRYAGKPSGEVGVFGTAEARVLEPTGKMTWVRAGRLYQRATVGYEPKLKVYTIKDLSKPPVADYTDLKGQLIRGYRVNLGIIGPRYGKTKLGFLSWEKVSKTPMEYIPTEGIFKQFTIGKGGGKIFTPTFTEPKITGTFTHGGGLGLMQTQKAATVSKTVVSPMVQQKVILKPSLLLASSLGVMAKQMATTKQKYMIDTRLVSIAPQKTLLKMKIDPRLSSMLRLKQITRLGQPQLLKSISAQAQKIGMKSLMTPISMSALRTYAPPILGYLYKIKGKRRRRDYEFDLGRSYAERFFKMKNPLSAIVNIGNFSLWGKSVKKRKKKRRRR